MTADEIKALVERLREHHRLDIVDFDLYLNATTALTDLSDQLAAKTELVTLLRASLAKSEREAERYREAIATVCEGWTIPDAARKILETALWSNGAARVQGKEGV